MLRPAGRTALDIHGLLVERAGEVVESEEIRRTVWRDKTVEDANLATQIFHLRESIGRDRIQTVRTRLSFCRTGDAAEWRCNLDRPSNAERWPPADPPAVAMRMGSMWYLAAFARTQRTAALASCNAAGYFASPERRYSMHAPA